MAVDYAQDSLKRVTVHDWPYESERSERAIQSRRSSERSERANEPQDSLTQTKLIKRDSLPPRTCVVPNWRRNPATVNPPKSIEDFQNRANAYFEECADNDIRPTITGFTVAVGLPGPTSLIRLGQRIPELRYSISQCLMAIASGYEDMIGYGNASGAMFMLKNIPDLTQTRA